MVGIVLASDTGREEEPPNSGVEISPPVAGSPQIVDRHRIFQQFLTKEGVYYHLEFMLDLEFNYQTGICTIHHLNLPSHLRNMGFGSRLIGETEKLARKLSMTAVKVPSEHRATSFWLKNGYGFTFSHEKDFYTKHMGRDNLYLAYDLQKKPA